MKQKYCRYKRCEKKRRWGCNLEVWKCCFSCRTIQGTVFCII